jgi:hypothetical protein
MADNEPEQQPDIQAIVDAAVKEAVAQSMAEMSKGTSRLERRNNAIAARRKQYSEERKERLAARRGEAEEPKAEKDPVEEKGEGARKAQDQNLGAQEPKAASPPNSNPGPDNKPTIAETVGSLHAPPLRNSFAPREVLYNAALKANTVNHPWRVIRDGETVVEGSPEVVAVYKLTGGKVYGQGATKEVLDQPIIGKKEGGFIYLEITRDPESRALSTVLPKHGTTIPVDTHSTQHRPLAQVFGVGGGAPLQLQFEEVRVWEMLLVENGEFSMHTFDMNNRNSYTPP